MFTLRGRTHLKSHEPRDNLGHGHGRLNSKTDLAGQSFTTAKEVALAT